jgi:hypothetical protein
MRDLSESKGISGKKRREIEIQPWEKKKKTDSQEQ